MSDDLAEYDNSFNGIAGMIGAMFLLPSITLVLRLVARYRQKVHLGKDDIFAILAWFFLLGPVTLGIYGMVIGVFGYPSPTDQKLLLEKRELIWKAIFAGLLTTVCSLGCARLSAIFFYRRLFHLGRVDAFDIITKVMAVVMVAWILGLCLATTLSCGTNVAGTWASDNTAVCGIYDVEKALTMSSFILDFTVLMLPLPKIWKLHVTTARKIAISAVFLMALVGVAAGIVRVTEFFVVTDRGAAANLADAYQANTRALFYQLLELGAVAAAINLPSIWYFFHDLSPEKLLRNVRSFVSMRSSSSTTFRDGKSSFDKSIVVGTTHDEKASFDRSVVMGAPYSGAVPSHRAEHELDI